MNGWLACEDRWLRALLLATIPPSAATPGLVAVNLATFQTRLDRAAPPLLRLGLRAATWILTWLPLLLPTFFRPFFGLSDDDRDRFLTLMAASDVFLLRQLAATVKVIACFALFADTDARAALGVQP